MRCVKKNCGCCVLCIVLDRDVEHVVALLTLFVVFQLVRFIRSVLLLNNFDRDD